MRNFKLTEAAKEDLRNISAYTKKTWGKEQEKVYRETIRTALSNIAKSPEIGRKREELAEDLRSFPVGNHIAYYIKKINQIMVVRILHPAMDKASAMKK
ncbi:MAG: type II toxin-antitoxin system RelE/ParE family toxin [Desulfobacteraceae bacterium]|jgi:toxin ParE1/3/4